VREKFVPRNQLVAVVQLDHEGRRLVPGQIPMSGRQRPTNGAARGVVYGVR
jgi:hypothetical protein